MARVFRLVLDTNVVLDLLVWCDPAALAIGAARRSGAAIFLCDGACLAELRDVLGREQFRAKGCDADALTAQYAEMCERPATHRQDALASLPQCRDPADQKFLELAQRGGADLLVTRDKALLSLARRLHGAEAIRILTPLAATAHLGAD